MTRRRRLIVLVTGGALIFLGAASLVAFRWWRGGPAYRPGEDLEGITADLARSLPKDYPRVTFADVTRQSGIDFHHFSGTRSSQLPEDMGSGAAWGDYDNDGWIDLAVANEVGPLTMSAAEQAQSPARLRVYRNNHDGTFTDATDATGIDVRGWAMAVAWADYDNDGRVDLVVTAYGQNRLFHNDGEGHFSDRSLMSGIGGPRGFWAGASWGDYDRDGFLDLYVTGYVKYTKPDSALAAGGRKFDMDNPPTINPSAFLPERNLLFHNNRDGTFTEVGRRAGVQDTLGRSLSAAWVDLDEDGWPDLYVANDVSDNVFYRNLGNGTFADLSHEARVADYRSAMGIAVGDWDGDGDQDMFLTHWIAQENALYDNMLAQIRRGAMAAPNGAPVAFMDDADRNGLGQSTLDFVGWATSFVDYDNDGALDLFMVNGSTLQSRDDSTRLVPMRNQLFWNHGRDGFFDVSPVAGATFRGTAVARGAALGDYDNDGDVDAFIVNNGGAGVLLRNEGGNRNHWMSLELRGTKSNRQGIGAKVRVVAGGKSYRRQIGAQSSYLSQNSLIETFGLGAISGVDTIEVLWPSGVRDVRAAVSANQHVTIVEGSAAVMANTSAGTEAAAANPSATKRSAFGSDRAKVQEFWSLYRQASSERIAGRIEQAATTYARALELNPDHEDVLYYYGSMKWSLGDFRTAETSWRHLLDVNPSSARTHSQLGRLHACLDAGAPFNLDSAEAHLRRAHEINKEESGPLVRLGEVKLLRGDLASAEEFFRKVLVTHQQSAPAHFYSGYIAWRRHEFDRAKQEFTRSVNATAMVRAAPAPGEGDTKKGTTPLRDDGDRCLQLRALSEKPKPGDPDVRYAELDAILRKRR